MGFPKTDPEVRFWKHVALGLFDCWEWHGSRGRYGSFNDGSSNVGSHRFAYKIFFGDIDKGLTIDHLCRNRYCVNPFHLEAVTASVNSSRYQTGNYRFKCHRGHANYEIYTKKGMQIRRCVDCKNLTNARYRARNRANILKRQRVWRGVKPENIRKLI
jgi:HNH endonuclease